ncbi:MAG TPA: hypothetical protein VKP65_14075 [Rhodothermales bacterium]|nr:hypothetical protein [Rhodothermales bacterium]
MDDVSKMDEIGQRTSLSCPDCGGVLWKMPDAGTHRYRCHIGHAYSKASLLEGQADATDQALIVALRTMEDRVRMLEQMVREDQQQNRRKMEDLYEQRATELKQHIRQIRELILGRPA